MPTRQIIRHSAHRGAFILCALFALVFSTAVRAAADDPQTQLASIDFRAVGHAPRWRLEVDRRGEVRFHVDGSRAIVHTSATGLNLRTGSTGAIYGAHTGTQEFLAEIVYVTCRDAMSSEALTHTVKIRLDGIEYSGCGRGFDSRE